MAKRILVTGGCGFVGHHFVEHLIKNTDWDIVVLDKLTYASEGFDRLRDIDCFDNKRITILTYDFRNSLSEGIKKEIGEVDYIVHMGAETHVDRSIENPLLFIESNIIGTYNMLEFAFEFAKEIGLRKFLYLSTDEVFGPALYGEKFKEDSRYNPSNPYAATKASAEMLCMAYANCYKLPIVIARSMNIFGERQNFEKFIPSTIRKVLLGEEVIIHADPTCTIPGSRFYIHARNVADALLFILEKTNEFVCKEDVQSGKFNIVGEKEVNNLELAQFIAKVIGKPLKYKLVDFHSSRPGHDLRYALDGSKLAKLGWKPPKTFEQSLEKTIKWTLEHKKWIGL